MAVVINGSTYNLKRTTSLPDSGAFTIAGFWMRRGNGEGSWETIFALEASSSTYHYLYCRDGTNRFSVYGVGSNSDDVAITDSVWYFVAMTSNGQNSGLVVYYGLAGNALTTFATNSQSFTEAQLTLGNNILYGGEWSNSRFAGIKVWDAVLTAAELEQERLTLRPQRYANLHLWTPMFPGSGERTRDYSGNGRDWTESGTITDEDPPPVSFGAAYGIVIPWAGVSATTVVLNTATIAAQGQASSIVEGEATTLLDTAQVAASGVVASVSAPSGLTVAIDTAQIAAQGQTSEIIEGEVSPDMATAQIAAQAQTSDIVPGAMTVVLDEAEINAGGVVLTTQLGAAPQTIAVDTAEITSQGQVSSVVEGEVTITLDEALIAAQGQASSVLEGEATTILDVAQINAQGQSATINAPAPGLNVALSTGQVEAQWQIAEIVEGAVSLPMDTAQITAGGQPGMIIAGAVSLLMSTGQITATGIQITISAPSPGAITVTLTTAQVAASGEPGDIIPGAISVALTEGQITAQGQGLSIETSTAILLATAALMAQGEQSAIIPGAASVSLDTALIELFGQGIIALAGIEYSTYSFVIYIQRAYSFDAEIRQKQAF